MPNEDLRKFYPEGYRPLPLPAVPAPEPEILEDEGREQPQEGEGKTVWVGAPDAPRQASDGISDLFEVDTDAEEADVDDLVDVDYEKDILDANENGDLEDLVDVSQEDIIGRAPQPKLRYRVVPRARRPIRYIPPTSMRGVR